MKWNKEKLRQRWNDGTIFKYTRITYDVAWNILLFFIIIGVVGLFFAGGVGAGYFASLVKDEPVRSEQELTQSIYNYEETSELYFSNGQFLGDVRSDLYREEVQLSNVNDNLVNAVIATEDENFNEHNGIVPKALFRAVVQQVTNSNTKTGGSTLTQQLVKNQILTNEVSFERKAKEVLNAMRIEHFFDKDQILEAYMNIVPFGRNANGQNIAGVQSAAQGIFGNDASELNVPQAAFIAGLPQNPFTYTPFQNSGGVKAEENLQAGIERMKEVLERMYEKGYITEREYEVGMNYDLAANLASPQPLPSSDYPWVTREVQDRAQEVLLEQLAKDDGHTMEDLQNDEKLMQEYSTLASRRLATGGLKVHATIDKEVYDVMQDVKNNYNNYDTWRTVLVDDPETGNKVEKEIPVEVGSVLQENSTGAIIGFIGGRDFDLQQLNHATQARRSNGSTMKPLLIYGPGMDLGAIQPGSVFADIPYSYPSTGGELSNYGGGYKGFVSARYALAKSYNIPAVKAYNKIVGQNPAGKYLENMGFEALTAEDKQNLSAGLGATNNGVTIEENTNGYATFGNMGTFVDAYMIDKIETKDGEVLYQHEKKTNKLFSDQTSYLLLDMMRDVMQYGTAAGLKNQLTNPGVDWAGKTGTSQEYKDTWFVATNPNVTMSMWMGYDFQEQLNRYGYSSRNTGLWADVVNAVSEIRPELMVPDQGFDRPSGIVSRSYCATSGLLVSDLCASVGLAESDIYNANYVPSQRDDSLMNGDFVRVKGDLAIAGPSTPGEFIINGGGVTLKPEFLEENGYDTAEELQHLIPDTGAWSNVALPSGGASGVSQGVANDGQAPSAPGGVSASGSTLSWGASPSSDVVGYRIYRASTPESGFAFLGSTTSTSISFSGREGLYAVRAVDYFGQQSGLSSALTIGNPGAPEPEPEPDPAPAPDPDPDPNGGNSGGSSSGGTNNPGGGNDSGNDGSSGNDNGNSGGSSGNGSDGSGDSGNQGGASEGEGSGQGDGSEGGSSGGSSEGDSSGGQSSESDSSGTEE
ncbi:transglycosylase domain-containing protein [Salimicrobium halophilum]|uniref:Penicillin-binding protein n=1 Tax=Salimicrobium halophilum TaxID=86666 RepID=A0A1G8VJM5_9BACI|nr:transglycosylase domain-containing protein [Salimicrobium halophilum]SDJ66272.1 penicillin-binding protein [Salimicrobium halophilum]